MYFFISVSYLCLLKCLYRLICIIPCLLKDIPASKSRSSYFPLQAFDYFNVVHLFLLIDVYYDLFVDFVVKY